MDEKAENVQLAQDFDEQEMRGVVVQEAINFRSLLTAAAGRMRRTNPRVAGALYVLERDVYESVSTGLLLDWPEPPAAPEREPEPAKKRPPRRAGCRHEYKGGDTCTKCGEARQRRRRAAPEPASGEGQAP